MSCRRSIRRTRRGLANLEALMSLMTLLVSFLGIAQLSALELGQLVVASAAHRAARATMVVLDDEPEHYDGAPRGNLTTGSGSTASPLLRLLGSKTDHTAMADSGPPPTSVPRGGSAGKSPSPAGARLQVIRQAAYASLAVLAPSDLGAGLRGTNLHEAVSGAPWKRLAAGLLVYSQAGAAITLRSPGGKPTDTVGPHDEVTVRVAFLVPCRVPLASRLVCHSGQRLALGKWNPLRSKRQQAISDELEAAESPKLLKAILASGGYYQLLVAETTVVNHGASYHQGDES